MNIAKRYSIFISSTFEDLKEERQAVQDEILSAGDFPVQMEKFPAADEDQFEFIKALIDKCDYYVLIIAGRYGTPAADGISYTEKEYHYAVSQNIPVLVMLHGNRGSIPVSKSESSEAGKASLEKFIGTVEHGRLRKTWTTHSELQLAVRQALDHAKATKPATGWVRGDTAASIEILEELNEVRRENTEYREAIGNLEVELSLPPIPAADSPIEIDLLPTTVSNGSKGNLSGTYAKISSTWLNVFPIFHSCLAWDTSDWGGETQYHIDVDTSCDTIGASLASQFAGFDTKGLYQIKQTTLDRLSSYFIEVGLMVEEGHQPFAEAGRRLARRQRIAGSHQTATSIIQGKVGVEQSSPTSYDDEIPF